MTSWLGSVPCFRASSAAWSSFASISDRSGCPSARQDVIRSVMIPISFPFAETATCGRFHQAERRFFRLSFSFEKVSRWLKRSSTHRGNRFSSTTQTTSKS